MIGSINFIAFQLIFFLQVVRYITKNSGYQIFEVFEIKVQFLLYL